MPKKVVIVGAGPGGLAAGMILSSNGFDVEIYEKNDIVGGRNGSINIKGYKFDIGPTFFMLKQVLDQVFAISGKQVSEYLDFKRLDPMYRLKFTDGKELYHYDDMDKMVEEIERVFPGEGKSYRKFIKKEGKKFTAVYPCLSLNYDKVYHYLRPTLLKSLPRLDFIKSIYDRLSSYFSDEKLKISMAFQAKYLGMSPWNCPATFCIIPFIEHNWGIHHPIGGLNEATNAMSKVIQENGGKIHLSKKVKEVLVENKKAIGILLENGEKVYSDYVILNSDFAYSMTKLIKSENRKKYTDENLAKREYSCSTFMLYLGVDKKYDIPHHNVFFAKDYKKNVEEIVKTKMLSNEPSIYIQNASITDETLAPEGKSTIYVLVPVPNNTSKINWEEEKQKFRDLVIDIIKTKTELKDIDQHIEIEKIITPFEWENEYNVYNGAVFNLSHNINQMLYLRPHNKCEELNNCYLVGGGTHPGSGLPTIYESGKISAELIMKDSGKSFNFGANSSIKIQI